jgi:hypothetical protein
MLGKPMYGHPIMKINTSAYKFPARIRIGKHLGILKKRAKKVGEIIFDDDGITIRNAPGRVHGLLPNPDSKYSQINRDISWSEIHYFGTKSFGAEEWGNVIGTSDIGLLAPVLTPAIKKYYDKFDDASILETIEWRLHIILANGESMSFEAVEFHDENDFRVLFRSIEAEAIASINNEHHSDIGNKFKWDPTLLEGVLPHRGGRIRFLGILGFLHPFFAIPAWRMGKADLEKMRDGLMDKSGRTNTEKGMKWGYYTCIFWGIMVGLAIIAGLISLVLSKS